MPIPLLLIGAGIMAAAGAAKAIHGANQAKQGRRMAANNKRPTFDIQQEYFDNQSLAQNMAQRGLSEASMNFYTNNANRGLTTATDTALQLGGGINSVSQAFDQYNQSLAGIAAADAEMRNQNIRYLMEANNQIAGQKTQKWALDKYEPYKDTARTAAAMQKIGTENIFSGISQVGSSVAAMGSAGNNGGGGGGFGSMFSNAGGAGSADTAITTVRPNATIMSTGPAPVSTGGMFAPQNNLQNVYDDVDPGRVASVDQIMQNYENSPYKNLIRQRLLGRY